MGYMICYATTMAKLEGRVDDALGEGWTICGGITSHNGYLMQAVERPEPQDTTNDGKTEPITITKETLRIGGFIHICTGAAPHEICGMREDAGVMVMIVYNQLSHGTAVKCIWEPTEPGLESVEHSTVGDCPGIQELEKLIVKVKDMGKPKAKDALQMYLDCMNFSRKSPEPLTEDQVREIVRAIMKEGERAFTLNEMLSFGEYCTNEPVSVSRLFEEWKSDSMSVPEPPRTPITKESLEQAGWKIISDTVRALIASGPQKCRPMVEIMRESEYLSIWTGDTGYSVSRITYIKCTTIEELTELIGRL